MKKITAILLAISLTSCLYGQCRYITNKSLYKKFQVYTPEKITKITQYSIISGNYITGNGSNGLFFKNDKGEYFFQFGFYLSLSHKFNVLQKNELVLQFGNNIDLVLNPISDFLGSQASVSSYVVAPIYKLSKEQVQVFTSNLLFNIKFYFSPELKIIAASEDEKGTYYEIEVKSDKYKSTIKEIATCILQD